MGWRDASYWWSRALEAIGVVLVLVVVALAAVVLGNLLPDAPMPPDRTPPFNP